MSIIKRLFELKLEPKIFLMIGVPDGAENDGGAGAEKLGGDAMELACVGEAPSDSLLPETSSTTMEGKRPMRPASSPSHQPSSTPLGQRFRMRMVSPSSKVISSLPVAS